jgi:hypothetical protein
MDSQGAARGQTATNANAAVAWLDAVNQKNRHDPGLVLDATPYPWLRTAQRRALGLPSWDCSILDGPPGTGKTTTLGVILASFLRACPNARVLLLSTTNTAVDLALLAVDRALEKLPGSGWSIRQRCKRLGHHFVASHYEKEGRKHLLPTPDPELVRKLADLESRRPDPQDVVAYSQWKRELDLLRARLRVNVAATLRDSRLAALTACAATFWTPALHEIAPFDLVVFDEASQVGLAYALALATFGRRCLFAGDPAQLAPIVQSEHKQPKKWLGRSVFDEIVTGSQTDGSPRVFLDEQSRMHEEICDFVSRLFYAGRLRVADRERSDGKWRAHRTLHHARPELMNHVQVLSTRATSTWSQKYRGPIRYESAKLVEETVADLLKADSPDSILVLTPFRAQRTLLRAMLRERCKGVTVSTVHRAQGSERRSLVFDPVDGTSDFLLGDTARRLINVALSRAEARLLVVLSEADRQNPLFAGTWFQPVSPSPAGSRHPHAAGALSTPERSTSQAEPIDSYLQRADFPRCLRGIRVRFRDFEGLVTDVTRDQITIENDQGATRTYHADFIRAMSQRPPGTPGRAIKGSGGPVLRRRR